MLPSLRETDTVTQAIEAAVAIYPFAEDVYNSATWRIVHEPSSGDDLTGYSRPYRLLYVMPNRYAGSPGLLVRYYEERRGDNDHWIHIDWVKYFEPDGNAGAETPKAFDMRR
jgi:hypothetical protein